MVTVSEFLLFLVFLTTIHNNRCENNSLKLDISVTQKIEEEGFHRKIKWLIESSSPTRQEWINSKCNLAVRLEVSNGMFVNPDEVAELSDTEQLRVHIEGSVDVEAVAHEAKEHIVVVYLNSSNIERIAIDLPVHLRYQRAQISGGFGKVVLKKPSILVWCPESLDKISGSGLKEEAPCDETGYKVCVWKNHAYQALFDEVEIFVPVGDLNDYPLVSIVTLLLGCAGCVYVLSILSTSPL